MKTTYMRHPMSDTNRTNNLTEHLFFTTKGGLFRGFISGWWLWLPALIDTINWYKTDEILAWHELRKDTIHVKLKKETFVKAN